MTFYNEFSRHYDTVFPFRPQVRDFLLRFLPAQGTVLDIGCGPGRYCQALTEAGRPCQGIDPDEGMVERARGLYPDLTFQALGMDGLDAFAPGSFQGVFCVGNVLPHLPAGQLGGFLAQIRRILVPEGVWLFQTVNFDPLLDRQDHVFPVRSFPEEGLEFHRRYRDITEDHLVFSTHLSASGREIFSGEVDLCPRRGSRLWEAHVAAGFRSQETFGDFSGAPFEGSTSPATIGVYTR